MPSFFERGGVIKQASTMKAAIIELGFVFAPLVMIGLWWLNKQSKDMNKDFDLFKTNREAGE